MSYFKTRYQVTMNSPRYKIGDL